MIEAKTSISKPPKCRKVNFALLLVLFSFGLSAQLTQLDAYVAQHSDEAISQMIRYKIPASIILAQAIFESNSGSSYLAKRSNNHFGIKCHTSWGGDTIVKTDDTYNECFRKYRNVEESYTDHSLFLKTRTRYAQLFKLPVTDYKSWCIGLKNSGYATYSGYAAALIEIIEDYKLYRFDRAEKIELLNHSKIGGESLLPGYFTQKNISLYDCVKSDILFTDERGALIQSLNLIMDSEITDIAENYKYCKPAILDGTHNV